MKKRFLTLVAILAFSIIPSATYALEYGGIGGSPANPREDNPRSASIFIYELEPGETFTDGVKVSNNSGETQAIKIGAVDSVASSDGSFACAQDGDDAVDVGAWVEVSSPEVTLKSGEERVVNFTLTVPKTASVGEHGGCITIQKAEANDATPDGGGVVLNFRSAIRIAVTIPGDIVKALSVSGVSLTQSDQDAGKYIIQPSLTNTGNVSLDTQITSKLVSLFGIAAGSHSSNYPVFPGTTAKWNFETDRPFWGGFYRAEVTATYNANTEDGIGQNSSQQEEVVTGTSSYQFISPQPAALIIELALLAALAIVIFLLIRKLRHRRTVKHHWRHHTVAEGESLQKIAKHYSVSWKKLASANRIRAPYHVEPGDKLKVPPKPEE